MFDILNSPLVFNPLRDGENGDGKPVEDQRGNPLKDANGDPFPLRDANGNTKYKRFMSCASNPTIAKVVLDYIHHLTSSNRKEKRKVRYYLLLNIYL